MLFLTHETMLESFDENKLVSLSNFESHFKKTSMAKIICRLINDLEPLKRSSQSLTWVYLSNRAKWCKFRWRQVRLYWSQLCCRWEKERKTSETCYYGKNLPWWPLYFCTDQKHPFFTHEMKRRMSFSIQNKTLWSNENRIVRIFRRIRIPHDHLLLDSALNIGPLMSRWEFDKFNRALLADAGHLVFLLFIVTAPAKPARVWFNTIALTNTYCWSTGVGQHCSYFNNFSISCSQLQTHVAHVCKNNCCGSSQAKGTFNPVMSLGVHHGRQIVMSTHFAR